MNLKENVPLNRLTWFQTGGAARYLFKPNSKEEVKNFLKESKTPYFCLGAGSNTLIRDHGFNGTIIKLGRDFRNAEIINDTLTVGSSCLNRMVVQTCLQNSLSGLEFLIGIPGSIGGAIAMNAGAQGFETKDFLITAEIMHPDGSIKHYTPKELQMTYRHTTLPQNSIILSAKFQLQKTSQLDSQLKIEKYLSHRDLAQPVKGRTGGSTFKNPTNQKAWELIDAVGLRGYQIGDAIFSEKHCNFIMNLGNAKSTDIENLGELARKRVKEKFNLDLEWEIKRIG